MTHPFDDLMDRTRHALLAGDLAQLGQLAPDLQRLADHPVTLDAATAGRVQRKARRNAQLLQAALRGLRAVRGRLLTDAGGADLTTYDALGRKATLATAPAAPAKRV